MTIILINIIKGILGILTLIGIMALIKFSPLIIQWSLLQIQEMRIELQERKNKK